jgi:hypothetical protein
MPRLSATGSISGSWTVHDTWTETFVGVRHIAYGLVPSTGRLDTEARTLCQLAVVGANHLMEIVLFKLLLPAAKGSGTAAQLTEALLVEATYHQMLSRWVPAVSGKAIDFSAEPFASTERLRRRRNDTVHKASATANSQMARSALVSSVDGAKAMHAHLGKAFPYADFLSRWPLKPEPPFSSCLFPR